MPPLMEKITKAAPNVRIDVVPWRGPAIFTAEFARTIDMVISIGNAFTGFHRQRLYTDSDALAVRRGHPIGARLKRPDVFLERAPRRGRDPRPERGPDRHLVAAQGYRTADRAGRARLYRGAARDRAHRSRRLRAAPPDRRAVEAIVADNGHATARSRDRRAVHVLPDPRPDGSRLDLAAQHHARHRPRDGARPQERLRRVGKAKRAHRHAREMERWWARYRFAHPTRLSSSRPPAPSAPPAAPTSACGDRPPSAASQDRRRRLRAKARS